MKVPRRYGVALRAYPAGYRASRGPELLATLADGDDDRGHPSTREAAALAYRGLMMRGRVAVAPQGLLVAAAVLVLVALTGGFMWAERTFLLGRGVMGKTTDGPSLWWALALGVTAYVAIAAGPFDALDSRRRRTAAALLACPLALAIFIGPGRILYHGYHDPGWIGPLLSNIPGAVFGDWSRTLPAAIAAVLGTWIALAVLAKLTPQARRQALGAALVILGAVAIAQTWRRPDFPVEYQSMSTDLGAAPFITAAGLGLALAALWRPRPRDERA